MSIAGEERSHRVEGRGGGGDGVHLAVAGEEIEGGKAAPLDSCGSGGGDDGTWEIGVVEDICFEDAAAFICVCSIQQITNTLSFS